MKKLIGVVVVAGLFVGCGKDGTRDVGEQPVNELPPPANVPVGPDVRNPPQQVPVTPTPGETNEPELPGENAVQTKTVDLRVLGVGAEKYSSLLLVPNRIEAYVGGERLELTPTWREVNLANMAHAEKIATFALPENATAVRFRVELGAAGGFERPGASGWIDTRSRVLEFEAAATELRANGQGVLVIDATKSFVDRDRSTLVFVPKYRVY